MKFLILFLHQINIPKYKNISGIELFLCYELKGFLR